MDRMFSDLVVSRDGAAARRSGLALPASLVLHAAAGTILVLLPLLTPDTLPPAETAPAPVPGLVRLPLAGGVVTTRPPSVRPPRPSPPPSMAFVADPTPLPELPQDDGLDIPAIAVGPVGQVVPCLIGCDPNGVPGGEPGVAGFGPGLSPAVTPLRPGGDIRPPLKERNVLPVYPEIARAARVQGNVVLDCTISREGRVVDVKVLSGHVLLQPAAVEAVRQWLYRPTLLNGVPVPVVMTVTVRFTLDR